MAKAKSNLVTASELEDLKSLGFVEGNPHTIPDNISPVLKSKLLQDMGYAGDGSSPNASDLNPADATSADRNQGNGPNSTGQQSALAKDDAAGKKQDATKK
jgi:hypothetical protein